MPLRVSLMLIPVLAAGSRMAPDRITWTQVGAATITMGATAYAGLYVTSSNSGVNTMATFDNVVITNSSGGTSLPDFTLSATSASTHTVNAGGTVSFALKTTSIAGYSQPISFTGLPNGTTPSFNPT